MTITLPVPDRKSARRRKPPAGSVENAPARLPKPLWDNWSWQESAACRDVNPDIFFSVDSERGLRRRAHEVLAHSLCSTCPVRQQCREHAIAVGEPYGVWGGTTEDERSA
jgi:WhiB family transcriptional regulator, redox-sensing transcriptional regulator